MRSSGLRHPWRYALTALALGPVFTLAIQWASENSHWLDSPEYHDILGGRTIGRGIAFTLTCACIAWFGRRVIATSTGVATWILSGLSTSIGGPVFMVFFMLGSLPREASEIVRQDGWSVLVLKVLGGTVGGALMGAMAAPLLLPVTLPLGWLALVLVRRAAGGLAEPSADRAPVAESGA